MLGHVPGGSPGYLQHGPGGSHPTRRLATTERDVLLALGTRMRCTRL